MRTFGVLLLSLLFLLSATFAQNAKTDSPQTEHAPEEFQHFVIKEHPNLLLLPLCLFGAAFVGKRWADQSYYARQEDSARQIGLRDVVEQYRTKKHRATAQMIIGSVATIGVTLIAIAPSKKTIRALPALVDGGNPGLKMTYNF